MPSFRRRRRAERNRSPELVQRVGEWEDRSSRKPNLSGQSRWVQWFPSEGILKSKYASTAHATCLTWSSPPCVASGGLILRPRCSSSWRVTIGMRFSSAQSHIAKRLGVPGGTKSVTFRICLHLSPTHNAQRSGYWRGCQSGLSIKKSTSLSGPQKR